MEEISFSRFIARLITFFERKDPSQESVNLWYQDCAHIPSEALPWIESRLRELEAWPRNLPAQIRRLWHDWRGTHPDKRAREEEGCEYCFRGHLLLSQDGSNYLHKCICHGGHKSRATLLAEGWQRPIGLCTHPYHDPFTKPTVILRSEMEGISKADIQAAVGNELPF